MATSILLGVEARLAKTDAMLLLTVRRRDGRDGARLSRERRPARHPAGAKPAIFWTALAAGILIKGPLILMFVGLAGAHARRSRDRSARWLAALRPFAGFALAAACWCCPGSSPSSRRRAAISSCRVGRPRHARQGDQRPGDAWRAARILSSCCSGSRSGRARRWPRWRRRRFGGAARDRGAQFLLAWLVPSWIVFELVMTKLPHYVLPLYPAIAILIAGVIERRQPVRVALAGARHRWMVPVSRRHRDRRC